MSKLKSNLLLKLLEVDQNRLDLKLQISYDDKKVRS